MEIDTPGSFQAYFEELGRVFPVGEPIDQLRMAQLQQQYDFVAATYPDTYARDGVEQKKITVSQYPHFTETNHKKVLAKIRVERSQIILIYQHISQIS